MDKNNVSSRQEKDTVPVPVYETIVPFDQMERTQLELAVTRVCDSSCGTMPGTFHTENNIKQKSNQTVSLTQSNSNTHEQMEMEETCLRYLLTGGDLAEGNDCTKEGQKDDQREFDDDSLSEIAGKMDAPGLAKKERLDGHRNGGTESLKVNKVTNSSNEIKDETTSPEHDYFQLEDFGAEEKDEERKVPWKIKTPRAYEVYVPSK